MNGAEWVDTVVRMQGYWLVRTLAGISMDIGMSLLIVNLMLTALNARRRRWLQATDSATRRPRPDPCREGPPR